MNIKTKKSFTLCNKHMQYYNISMLKAYINFFFVIKYSSGNAFFPLQMHKTGYNVHSLILEKKYRALI